MLWSSSVLDLISGTSFFFRWWRRLFFLFCWKKFGALKGGVSSYGAAARVSFFFLALFCVGVAVFISSASCCCWAGSFLDSHSLSYSTKHAPSSTTHVVNLGAGVLLRFLFPEPCLCVWMLDLAGSLMDDNLAQSGNCAWRWCCEHVLLHWSMLGYVTASSFEPFSLLGFCRSCSSCSCSPRRP